MLFWGGRWRASRTTICFRCLLYLKYRTKENVSILESGESSTGWDFFFPPAFPHLLLTQIFTAKKLHLQESPGAPFPSLLMLEAEGPGNTSALQHRHGSEYRKNAPHGTSCLTPWLFSNFCKVFFQRTSCCKSLHQGLAGTALQTQSFLWSLSMQLSKTFYPNADNRIWRKMNEKVSSHWSKFLPSRRMFTIS